MLKLKTLVNMAAANLTLGIYISQPLPSAPPTVVARAQINQEAENRRNIKFDLAYLIAKKELPFARFHSLLQALNVFGIHKCKLIILNGFEFKQSYPSLCLRNLAVRANFELREC